LETIETRRLLSAPDPTVIDVMVVYTPTAKAEAGGEQIIVDRIHRAVADSNLMLSRSKVNVTLRLFQQQQVDYDDATEHDVYTHFNRLTDAGDGYLDEVYPLTRQYGADAVSLWTSLGYTGRRRGRSPGDFHAGHEQRSKAQHQVATG
jgi:hypothetical protein